MALLGFRSVAGNNCNLVARMVNNVGRTVSISGTADTSWPLSNIYDNRPDVPFKWSAFQTNGTITIDTNHLKNGDFEDVDITPWVQDAGTLTRDTGTKNSGAASGKIVTATNAAGKAHQDYVVNAGELFKVSWAIQGPNSGGHVSRVSIQNQHTGNWLTSGGAWQTAQAFLDTQTAAAFKTGNLTATCEDILTCHTQTPTLRFIIDTDTPGGVALTVFFDDLLVLVGVNYSGLHGLTNVGPCAVELHSSTDNFAANDVTQATLAISRRPVAFALLDSGAAIAPVYVRYWRIKIVGTPFVNPSIGEWVLGQSRIWLRNPDPTNAIDVTMSLPTSKQTTPGGMPIPFAMATYETANITVRLTLRNETEWRAHRELLYGFCQGALYPMVLIPVDTDSDIAAFGRLQETPVKFVRGGLYPRKAEWTLTEMPFPL